MQKSHAHTHKHINTLPHAHPHSRDQWTLISRKCISRKSVLNTGPLQGEPWFEDLITLRPSPKLRIEHTGGTNVTLLQEDVFKLFRPYGKILQLTCEKNVAFVTYVSKKSAISARNCLHNMYALPSCMCLSLILY